MEKTSSRLELTNYLVKILKNTPNGIIDKIIYLIQGKLGPDHNTTELGIAEKLLIKSLSLATGFSRTDIMTKYNELGDIGNVAYEIQKNKLQTTLYIENLTVEKVYDTLVRISNLRGAGSIDLKLKYIVSLLNNSSGLENKFILKLILGNLRLGIADFTVLDAIAVAFTKEKKNRKILEEAFNVSSDLGKIGLILSKGSLESLKSISISLFTPIRPMLAERVSSSIEAIKKMGGNCLAEYKIDGERIQIHIEGRKIELFTRNLENVTSNFPDIIDELEKMNHKNMIAEGEIVATDPKSQNYLPFQYLMHRKRKYNVQEAIKNYPVVLNFFDILYFNGQIITNRPFEERRRLLEDILKTYLKTNNVKNKLRLITQKKVSSEKEIDTFLETALKNGCEGLMIKNPKSQYRAGAREWAWIKLKKEYAGEISDSIDLVIIGALYGRGRRTGKYGTFLLASYDPSTDTFYTVCKVGTGFTDESLETISNSLKKHVIKYKHPRVNTGQLKMEVWFEPNTVIEINSPQITLSPVYTTGLDKVKDGYGLALRFPKFTGKIREDKKAEDSTTIEEILDLYKTQSK